MDSRMVSGCSHHATGLKKISRWHSFENHLHISHILLPVPSVGCYSRGGHEVIPSSFPTRSFYG